MITKEELEHAYTVEQLTQDECANKFNCSKRTIADYMHKYGIRGRVERNEKWKQRIADKLNGSSNWMLGKKGSEHPNFKYTNEQVLNEFKAFAANGAPKAQDCSRRLLRLVVSRFGSFNNAVRLVGYEPRQNGGQAKYTEEQLIQELKNKSKDGFAPTIDDDVPLVRACQYHFGLYSKAVKLAGLKHKPKSRCGPENGSWKGGYKDYYGPNWEQQRKLARERDCYKCQICNVSEQEIGRQLDVHHKKSFREFNYLPGENENYLEANKLDNLISLCYKCHAKITNGKEDKTNTIVEPNVESNIQR